ncbi:hypothetical protein FRC12_024291, partial [Ceratobasidium sp. 428]
MITRSILVLAALSAVGAEMDFAGGYWKRNTGGPSTFVIPLALDKSGFYHSNVRMGSDDQKFNFSLSGSTGYTVVAGQVCNACGDQNPLYSSANSSSFQSLGSALDISVDGINQVFGTLAKENCGLKQTNGSWWPYNNQTVLVAGSVNDGTRDVFTPQISGILGLSPMAQTRSAADTVLGAWLARNPQAKSVAVGFALKRPDILNATANALVNATNVTAPGNNTSSPPPTGNNTASAGEMHMLAPDPDAYNGQLSYSNVESYESSGGPTTGTGGGQQMQASGWSTKLERWEFLNSNGEQVTGGEGAIAA